MHGQKKMRLNFKGQQFDNAKICLISKKKQPFTLTWIPIEPPLSPGLVLKKAYLLKSYFNAVPGNNFCHPLLHSPNYVAIRSPK